MVRTQIQLTKRQHESLKRLSADSGRSLADLTREALEMYLSSQRAVDRDELVKRAVRALGKHSSAVKNISRNHDHYLAEAFGK